MTLPLLAHRARRRQAARLVTIGCLLVCAAACWYCGVGT